MTSISRNARLRDETLTRALVGLAARGRQRPRCGDSEVHDFWMPERQEERALAVAWCAGCLILEACGAAADHNDERFGVWAGVDRTPRPGRKAGTRT